MGTPAHNLERLPAASAGAIARSRQPLPVATAPTEGATAAAGSQMATTQQRSQQHPAQAFDLHGLPDDLFEVVLVHLSPWDVVQLARASKRSRDRVYAAGSYWLRLANSRIGPPTVQQARAQHHRLPPAATAASDDGLYKVVRDLFADRTSWPRQMRHSLAPNPRSCAVEPHVSLLWPAEYLGNPTDLWFASDTTLVLEGHKGAARIDIPTVLARAATAEGDRVVQPKSVPGPGVNWYPGAATWSRDGSTVAHLVKNRRSPTATSTHVAHGAPTEAQAPESDADGSADTLFHYRLELKQYQDGATRRRGFAVPSEVRHRLSADGTRLWLTTPLEQSPASWAHNQRIELWGTFTGDRAIIVHQAAHPPKVSLSGQLYGFYKHDAAGIIVVHRSSDGACMGSYRLEGTPAYPGYAFTTNDAWLYCFDPGGARGRGPIGAVKLPPVAYGTDQTAKTTTTGKTHGANRDTETTTTLSHRPIVVPCQDAIIGDIKALTPTGSQDGMLLTSVCHYGRRERQTIRTDLLHQRHREGLQTLSIQSLRRVPGACETPAPYALSPDESLVLGRAQHANAVHFFVKAAKREQRLWLGSPGMVGKAQAAFSARGRFIATAGRTRKDGAGRVHIRVAIFDGRRPLTKRPPPSPPGDLASDSREPTGQPRQRLPRP